MKVLFLLQNKQIKSSRESQTLDKGIDSGIKSELGSLELGIINRNHQSHSKQGCRKQSSSMSPGGATCTEEMRLKTLKRELGSFSRVLTTMASQVTEVNKLNLLVLQYIKLLSQKYQVHNRLLLTQHSKIEKGLQLGKADQVLGETREN